MTAAYDIARVATECQRLVAAIDAAAAPFGAAWWIWNETDD